MIRYFNMKKIIFLCCYLIISPALLQGVETGHNRQDFDSLTAKIKHISFHSRSKALLLMQELRQLAQDHPDSLNLKKECLYYEAEIAYAQGIYDSTLIQRLQYEFQRTNKSKQPFQYAILQYAIALNHLTNGNYAEAFSMTLHSLEQFTQLKDSAFITETNLSLGRVCSYIESYRMAEDYYQRARKFTNPSRSEYFRICSNIYTTRLEDLDVLVDSLQNLIPVFERLQDTSSIASTYLNIGLTYAAQQKYDKTYENYLAAQKLHPYIDNQLFSISLWQNLGTYYLHIDNLKESYKYFQTAKNLAVQSGNPYFIASILPSLAVLHEKLHHNDSAYIYLKEYNALRNKLSSSANPIEAYQAYVNVFLAASQKELTIKEQEILLQNTYFIVTLISATGIILLIISWVVILQQQKRHIRQQTLLKEAENRDLEERLQSKQEIERLQKAQIHTQSRELTTHALALSNKNQILQQISNILDRVHTEPAAIEDIRKIIKNNIETDKAWKNFVVHFDKVHPNFFDRLQQISNELSKNDIRLSAYFRIGMTSKQIAQMINVSADSIYMHRCRLKKKLNLTDEQDLDDFIQHI